MKLIYCLLGMFILLSSCGTTGSTVSNASSYYNRGDTLIITSLFNDRNATIAEENVGKILDGQYRLPQKLRVAVVRLEGTTSGRTYYRNFWNDEQYLKTQQSYLDLFSEKFSASPRVSMVSGIPDLLISKTPTFTNIREAALRMQADIVVVYSIVSDLYSKYKFFDKPDIKAFATTQLIVLDVRTGLIPFSSIVTKDTVSQRNKSEMNNSEAAARVQNNAVLLTIDEIGKKITNFLNKD